MFKRILVPVDGSEPSTLAASLATELAKSSGGQLRLVHVVDQMAHLMGPAPALVPGEFFESLRESGQQVLGRAEAAARAAGVSAETKLIEDPGRRLGDAVAEAASEWAADLIVVGTHGRRGPSRLLLGSGAEQVIRLAPVPVLVSRANGQTGTQEPPGAS